MLDDRIKGMTEPHLFVPCTDSRVLADGTSVGGPLRVKMDSGTAILAFTTREVGLNFVVAFGLDQETVVLDLSEAIALHPASIFEPDNALVFDSLDDIRRMRATPNGFNYAAYLVAL
jgi:hypothetical protein